MMMVLADALRAAHERTEGLAQAVVDPLRRFQPCLRGLVHRDVHPLQRIHERPVVVVEDAGAAVRQRQAVPDAVKSARLDQAMHAAARRKQACAAEETGRREPGNDVRRFHDDPHLERTWVRPDPA